ncbi:MULTISPECIES: hypothetical protein [unclassified Mesorhizobium]|uniref:hypothetical protein n=1 Tax=unclassified Mesorhizobium TaxID=325217 RepID=UPI001CCED879|nr:MULTISPECIES: hypothetical protein [unclassified Mesorhizobium]MBZ9742194.1 hypothetical protein [Mesorhizobium sp. CO1-1-4]MBZ9805798.1 hypothetical protein [Mesorhizobium sp. ES1-6]MBZ9996204.1 hypothetical protein [Mesorhizobium sp. BH1-1-4]
MSEAAASPNLPDQLHQVTRTEQGYLVQTEAEMNASISFIHRLPTLIQMSRCHLDWAGPAHAAVARQEDGITLSICSETMQRSATLP